MSAAPRPRRACGPHRPVGHGPADLYEHVLTASVLLLVHDTHATSRDVCDGLAALGLHQHPASLQRRLESMEDVGLVFSTWGPSADSPERHTFHIASDGTQWLRHATRELQSAELFLGAFVSRCAEHCLTPPSRRTRRAAGAADL